MHVVTTHPTQSAITQGDTQMAQHVSMLCIQLEADGYKGDRLGHAIWLTAQKFGVSCRAVEAEIAVRIQQRIHKIALDAAQARWEAAA